MQNYYFNLTLTRDEMLRYYQGQVQAIVVTTLTGVRVQFPAMHLRQYMTTSGINGKFCLKTQNNKFFSLIKVSV